MEIGNPKMYHYRSRVHVFGVYCVSVAIRLFAFDEFVCVRIFSQIFIRVGI